MSSPHKITKLWRCTILPSSAADTLVATAVHHDDEDPYSSLMPFLPAMLFFFYLFVHQGMLYYLLFCLHVLTVNVAGSMAEG